MVESTGVRLVLLCCCGGVPHVKRDHVYTTYVL